MCGYLYVQRSCILLKVRGYPTIKMFPAGKKDGDTVEFDGGRTADDIVAWALDKLAENVPAPDVLEASFGDPISLFYASLVMEFCLSAFYYFTTAVDIDTA